MSIYISQMCYHYNPADLTRLQKLYPDKFGDKEFTIANGFTNPRLPVITQNNASLMQWGLIPHWAKDEETAGKLSKMCLNAKIETLAEKPSFRDALKNNQRCLIPAQSFYEWRWEDEKGKTKTKYEIKHSDTDFFYFGGLYSAWTDKRTGEIVDTFTIITCGANQVMAKIHNIKKRMPTLITNETAELWLENKLSAAALTQITQAQDLEGFIMV